MLVTKETADQLFNRLQTELSSDQIQNEVLATVKLAIKLFFLFCLVLATILVFTFVVAKDTWVYFMSTVNKQQPVPTTETTELEQTPSVPSVPSEVLTK